MGRVLRAQKRLSFTTSPDPDVESLDSSAVRCQGSHRVANDSAVFALNGERGIFRIKLCRSASFSGNGMSTQLRVSGWDSLRAVIVGYMHGNELRSLRIPNLLQDEWVDVTFGQDDLAYRIQNGWDYLPPGPIADLLINLEGQPAATGASVEIRDIVLWLEATDDFLLNLGDHPTTFCTARVEPNLSSRFQPTRRDLLRALDTHLARFFSDAEVQAKTFLATGQAPSHDASIDWPYAAALPPKAQELVINRWSWHAFKPVIVLLTYARRSGATAPVFAARDFVNAWLDRSYYAVDPDEKYCWYDHGVAGRMIGLVLLWDYGVQFGFDQRCMTRLLEAIYRHMQLLASEAFYACYQSTRYHNHAVFQDLALMFAGLALPELGCARDHFMLAAARVKNQLDRLVILDGDYGVQVENSIGYHQGFEILIQTAHDFIELGQVESSVPHLARSMARFTELSRYVDGRSPAFGDSIRQANPARPEAHRRSEHAAPALTTLPLAGYAFAKGNHDRRPFMLSVIASALGDTHKHEDHLSFSLFFNGLEWLIDPSFYVYEENDPVASYLRRATAHNAVVLPGHPYSLAPGLASLTGSQGPGSKFALRGWHTAHDSLRMEREITGDLDQLSLRFVERVVSQNASAERAVSPTALLMLHCGDGVDPGLSGADLILRHPGSDFELAIGLPSDVCRRFHGDVSPNDPRGFAGLGYGKKAPCWTIECAFATSTPAHWNISARPRSS